MAPPLCYDHRRNDRGERMQNKLNTHDLAYIAMGVALIAICAWISIPMTIPFTMQTFAICLVSALFGTRRGLWTVGCYLLLGAAGVPVFTGFKAGIGALLGTTGGYLAGFLFTALIVGAGVKRFGRGTVPLIVSMALGILACYAFGTAWFVLVYTKNSGPIAVGTALSWCVLPYLLPDAVKIALAAALVGRLYPLLDREGRTE